MKLTKRQTGLLFEAYRRNDMADSHERSKPLRNRWLGLGTEAIYRPVIDGGLMVFHDGRIPPAKYMGWLCLTPRGVDAFLGAADEFAKKLAELKQNTDYQQSYTAHYSLAGGLC